MRIRQEDYGKIICNPAPIDWKILAITLPTSITSTSTSITSKLLSSSSSSTNDANDDKRLFAIRSSKIYNNGNNSNGALWMSYGHHFI